VAQQFKLINGSTRTIKIGDLLKLHATKKNSCDLANLGDIIIGTSSQQASPGGWCTINPQGMVDWNNILNRPPRTTISDIEPIGPNNIGDFWIIPSQT
jgi:hypothetical protein